MNSEQINIGASQFEQSALQTIEEKYGATYLGDFCVRVENGGWVNKPVSIFYQEPPRPDVAESPWFGIHTRHGSLMITDGSSAFSEPIQCVIADNGEIIYSRWRHDYRESEDGSVTIDGGRDYYHGDVMDEDKICWLTADKDELILFETIEECEQFIEERDETS